jgi:hypothetical protein
VFSSTKFTLFSILFLSGSLLIIWLPFDGWQIRVSAVLTNGAYLLNVDCDHYFNSSKALREAMCFMMDPALGRKTCYVQFPQRFDGIDLHDRYANRNIVFFDVSLVVLVFNCSLSQQFFLSYMVFHFADQHERFRRHSGSNVCGDRMLFQ